MGKRTIAALGVVAASTIGAVALMLPPAAGASTQAQVPPACVRVPVPNPFVPGAQIQVGYCP
jgi:hypothetical protein